MCHFSLYAPTPLTSNSHHAIYLQVNSFSPLSILWLNPSLSLLVFGWRQIEPINCLVFHELLFLSSTSSAYPFIELAHKVKILPSCTCGHINCIPHTHIQISSLLISTNEHHFNFQVFAFNPCDFHYNIITFGYQFLLSTKHQYNITSRAANIPLK